MKLLLLTDIPPSQNLTAGLVLSQLCRFLEPGSLASFTVLNRHLVPEPVPELEWVPTRTVMKPNEFAVRRPPALRAGALSAIAIESYKRLRLAPRLVDQAALFAREQGVDAIWAVLQGQTMVRMALPLARQLGKPLLTHVWDPLGWWLKAHNVDRLNRHLALKQFDATMRASASCATASWAMAEEYERKYGVPSVPVIASHDRSLAARPRPDMLHRDRLVIGMAGQFYASEEWTQLIRALSAADWQVAGRQAYLKVLGHNRPPGDIPADRLDFVGWRSQADVVRILSEETDLLYCPYPFAPEMEEVARLSFPSKVPIYMAAGRPIVFHGPSYSSPARYFASTQAAIVCDDLYPAALYNSLERVVRDPGTFGQIALAAQDAFERDFTLERMRANFELFLQRASAV